MLNNYNDDESVSFLQKVLSHKATVSLALISIGLVVMIFLNEEAKYLLKKLGAVTALIMVIGGIVILVPFNYIFNNIIVDPRDYTSNKSKADLTRKLRLRALLFNNLSVVVLAFITIVIVVGFYFVLFPPLINRNKDSFWVDPVSITTLIIFLVHVLFRVFKYLIRVAAFYNAKGDSIEYMSFEPFSELTALSEIFTPNNYDISDLPSAPSLGSQNGAGAIAQAARSIQPVAKQVGISGSLAVSPGLEAN